ncbi:hypothetical protein ACQ4PT_060056 [Festuca glaucescens]
MVRRQVMEENVSRMSEILKRKAVENGKPMQDFTVIARSFVFGDPHPAVTVTKGKEAQLQQKEITEDPNYEPDPAEEATADDEFVPDEQENDVVQTSSKWSRRNGGAKVQIDFTPGMRRPTDTVQAAKLISECGVHIRSKMPLATHWKQYVLSFNADIKLSSCSLQGKIVMDKSDGLAKEICTDIIKKGIRQQRYRLKRDYWDKVKGLSLEQALLLKPDNVEEESWRNLLTILSNEHYKVHNSYCFSYIYH